MRDVETWKRNRDELELEDLDREEGSLLDNQLEEGVDEN